MNMILNRQERQGRQEKRFPGISASMDVERERRIRLLEAVSQLYMALGITRMQRWDPAKRLRFLFGLAVVWLFVTGLLILLLCPDLPKTELGWFLLVVIGPPFYVAGEGFFGWLFSEKHGKEISNKQFSLLRVSLAFAVVAVLMALGAFVSFIIKQ